MDINFINSANYNNSKINFLNKETQSAKSPQRKSDSLKVTGITKINNLKHLSVNSDRKAFTSERKMITSCDIFFSEDSKININNNNNTNNKDNNLDTKNNKLNNINYNNKNSNEFISINNILSNNFSKNMNKTIQSKKQEKIFNVEVSCEETKIKRLRRIIKDSLGGSSCGFDLSCMQKQESPNKRTSIKSSISNSTIQTNNFKIPVKVNNNNTIKNSEDAGKTSGNNSTRYYQERNTSTVFSKSRPASKQNKRIASYQHPNSVGITSRNFYNKASHIQKDFDNFLKKVNDNLQKDYETKSKKVMEFTEDNINNNDNAATNKKNVKTFEFDLEGKSQNLKNSEKHLKYDFKYDKDKLSNNYVTLDLFNLKKNSNAAFNTKVDNYHSNHQSSSRAKNENTFKTTLNKDKKFHNDQINSNFSTNNNSNNSSYPKFTLKSNSISKTKISLSSKQFSRK